MQAAAYLDKRFLSHALVNSRRWFIRLHTFVEPRAKRKKDRAGQVYQKPWCRWNDRRETNQPKA